MFLCVLTLGCCWFLRKTCTQRDLVCVEWDVKPYSLFCQRYRLQDLWRLLSGIFLFLLTCFINFYRATACNATHGIAVAILSVHLSVRCVYCDKTKQRTVNILIPHETAVTLIFWHQQWLVGNAPFHVNICRKWPTPSEKRQHCDEHVLCRACLTYNNCQQLQNELFGCRHSTQQSHGLSAIAEPLVSWRRMVDYAWLLVCLVVSSVSERPCTTVPVGLLRPGRQCWHSAVSAFRQPSTTCSASLPTQHLRPSGLFSCRPHSLELSPGFYPGPDHQWRLF